MNRLSAYPEMFLKTGWLPEFRQEYGAGGWRGDVRMQPRRGGTRCRSSGAVAVGQQLRETTRVTSCHLIFGQNVVKEEGSGVDSQFLDLLLSESRAHGTSWRRKDRSRLCSRAVFRQRTCV